jgi:GT2 family glycosyltransferase
MSPPPVAVVVVNWNGLEDTQRCLDSLGRLDYPAIGVIVVDNGSTDGSAARLAAIAGVELVRSDRNLGFAGGANLGIRRGLAAGAAYVWLLNNDTEVEPGTLSALVEEAEVDPRIGIVGGVLPEAWGGGRINQWTGVVRPVTDPGERPDYIAGTCMLVRREVFERIGLFDEAFFFYYEDADLCRRARAAGWQLAVAPDARVEHEGGASVNRGAEGRSELADRLQAESSGVYVGKHLGEWGKFAMPVRIAGIVAKRLARGQPQRIPGLVQALRDGVKRGSEAATRLPECRPQ